MTLILTIANQKGGVGKTTTSVNLAAALSQLGKRALLVDLDPQGNATMGSGIDKRQIERSVYDVLIDEASVNEIRQRSDAGGYYLLPANRELAGAEVELVELERRERRLRDALDKVSADYDYILIDAPPSLSLLTLNGLCAAQGVIIPMQCEYYALEGLSDLVGTIRKVHANFNPEIRIMGILRVMYDSRITLAQQVSAQLEEHFKEKVFKAVIPRNIRLAEAPSHGLPGVRFDPGSRGALGYLDFASELIERTPEYVAQMQNTRRPQAASAPVPVASREDSTQASTHTPESADETTSEAVSTEAVSTEAVSPEAVSPEAVSSDPVSSDPVSSDPVSSDPVSSDPVSTDPVSTDPVTTENVTEEQVQHEESKA